MVKVDQGDLVFVDWLDHSGGSHGWVDVTDYDADDMEYPIRTAGFVAHQNKARLILVQNWARNDMVNHHITIEKKLIKTIKILKKGSKV